MGVAVDVHKNLGKKIVVQNINKSFQDNHVVKNFSLKINPGEFLTLLGPSGSGKTTILKMLAGFEQPNDGHIRIGKEDLTKEPPNRRNIGMVFQNYALFPHMTVFKNIAFPLLMRKVNKTEIKKRVMQSLSLVKLNSMENRYPKQLSGGQQQRVALARAIVFEPQLLLMDEPLSALDKNLRNEMQVELKRLQQELNITTINVTHDQEEALTLSDRIAILNDGRLEQVGTPTEVYESPTNKFVASFIGESNIFDLTVMDKKGDQLTLCSESGLKMFSNIKNSSKEINSKLTVVIRPEKIKLIGSKNNLSHYSNVYQATIKSALYTGSEFQCQLLLKNEVIITKWPTSFYKYIEVEKEVTIGWDDEDMIIIYQ